ncbi:hypothetical protein F5I97DRAFT_1382091 [Phlebopus sp. FC_14]|nr:hypothetical protein F5I97DRAFT_1382091 [Phlebopus sp. FC_14]
MKPAHSARGRRGRAAGAQRGKSRSSHLDGRRNTPGFNDRRMDHIASISRSSGLEKDGDSLKDYGLQESYRTFIDEKLKAFWDVYMVESREADALRRQKRDGQENILILFRKLREGIFSSGRKDKFALEVYETSLYCSVIFDSPAQTTSILSHPLPSMYASTNAPHPSCFVTVLIILLHNLVNAYPSQRTYFEQLKQITPNFLERSSPPYGWIATLALSLRTLNFIRFEQLSRPAAFEQLLPPVPDAIGAFRNLPRDALSSLVSRLRLKARGTAWAVLRNGYRELSSSEGTRSWLCRQLLFESIALEHPAVHFEEWVEEECRHGHLRRKEGIDGRWIVCKPR